MKKILLILASLLIAANCFATSGELETGGGGGGNVIGPVVGTDNCFPRFDGDGQHLQNSGVCSTDLNDVSGMNSLDMLGPITWALGASVDGTKYSIQRDSDATNQLHFNAPSGSSFEFSINDSPGFVLNSGLADFQTNNIKTDGGVATGPDGYSGCQAGFCNVNNYTGTITDFSGGTYQTVESYYITLDPSADLDTLNGGTFINVFDFETRSPSSSTKNFDVLVNFYYYTQLQGSGHVTQLINVQNGSIIAGTRSADENIAYNIQSGHFGTGGNITDDYTFEFESPSHGNGGTMTNHWGIFMADQEFGTNSWAIETHGGKIEFGAPSGKDYAVLLSDDDVTNPFSGLGIPTHAAGILNPISSTGGGVRFTGVSDGDTRPLELNGFYGTTDPTDNQAAVNITGGKYNGAGNAANLGNSETVIRMSNNSARIMTALGSTNVSFGPSDPDYSLEVLRSSGSDVTFALSDGDVTNPFSSSLQTDTFFHVGPGSSTIGGAQVTGITDGDSIPLNLRGLMGTASPSNGTAYIRLFGAKTNGSGGLSDVGNSETLFEVVNNSLGSTFPAIMCQGNRLCAMSGQNPNARLEINSNGSDSSSQSFRVTDSGDGSAMFNVRNDRRISMGTTSPTASVDVRQKASSSGLNGLYNGVAASNTNLTNGTENILWTFDGTNTQQWAQGDITTQRFTAFKTPTISIAGGGGIVTTAATLAVAGAPVAGSGASITSPVALWVQGDDSRFDGGIYQHLKAVASADKLDPAGENNMVVTGTTTVTCIKKGSATPGTEITIDAESGFTVKHLGCTTSADNLAVALAGAADYVMTADDTLTLMLTHKGSGAGTNYWVEKARAVTAGPVPPP